MSSAALSAHLMTLSTRTVRCQFYGGISRSSNFDRVTVCCSSLFGSSMSQLVFCKIQSTHVTDYGQIESTYFQKCLLARCSLTTDSTIQDCGLFSTIPAASPPTTVPFTLSLRKLVPEIRVMIFPLCMKGISLEDKASLIVALRGDTLLYHEALDVLQKSHVFALSYHNRALLESMSPKAFGRTQRLSIV